MAEANSYEELRRRQVEENKRKLDELRLHHLSAAVREAAAKPKPTMSLKRKRGRPPGKPRASRNAREDALLRRSGRIASLPGRVTSLPEQPDYLDVDISGTCSNRRELPDRLYAISKAAELYDELGSDYPTFVKPMTKSYATGYGLPIPLQFSKKYLSGCDEMIFLVDEEDGEFHMLYLAHRSGIGAGWKGFAIDHKMADGDCLVFQLVERTKFKVYITRASSYYENDH